MSLTVVIGLTGRLWERQLLDQLEGRARILGQCRTMVDLLVTAEVAQPSVVVVGEDLPRLHDGLASLRGYAPVVVVGTGPLADCPADRIGGDVLEAVVGGSGAAGTLTTVWGPQGSWGTTSVAVALARALSARAPTLLMDANVHAPGIGDLLNLPLGGLLHACLSADRASPELPARHVSRSLAVLTGVDPGSYPAVHPGALRQVLEAARREYERVVVDVDSAVDAGGEIGLVPDWTTATAVGLGGADHVVIVVGEGRIALTRLWRALPAVAAAITCPATVVINRCTDRRSSSAVAARLGEFLPDASVGWISGGITDAALQPIVEDIVGAGQR